jgi:hypothetical protein
MLSRIDGYARSIGLLSRFDGPRRNLGRFHAAHSAGRERALGLRSGDRPQRLCTVAELALDARKDLGIPVGSMPVQL